MKHGVAFRKFSRPTAHRMLMLRNLVTSLFEHEQIKTTLPKARDTARLAEKMITLGKKGLENNGAKGRATAFLLKPIAFQKLFSTLAERYAERPGGYTRIHKFGNRPGDNAPHAILELVDNPRDLRWEMTSRAIGRETAKRQLSVGDVNTQENVLSVIKSERNMGYGQKGVLRPMTRWNLQKVLRFRPKTAPEEISAKAAEYSDEVLATPMVRKSLHDDLREKDGSARAPRLKAGTKPLFDPRPALDIAKAKLGERPHSTAVYGQKQKITMERALNGKELRA